MKERIAQEIVEVPADIDVSISQSQVLVQGPQGELRRDFSHAPIDIRREKDLIVIEAHWPDKKRAAMVGTIRSHLRNMITGVTKGFTYKLKIVYAHFPMSVRVNKGGVTIENFHGERKPRRVKVPRTVEVSVVGDDVIVKGIDLEEVSQAAANIQQATRIKKKDPRVFLDGIYVYEKGEGL